MKSTVPGVICACRSFAHWVFTKTLCVCVCVCVCIKSINLTVLITSVRSVDTQLDTFPPTGMERLEGSQILSISIKWSMGFLKCQGPVCPYWKSLYFTHTSKELSKDESSACAWGKKEKLFLLWWAKAQARIFKRIGPSSQYHCQPQKVTTRKKKQLSGIM